VFKLKAPFEPKGDQIKAIESLKDNFLKGVKRQVLRGATGTGKTFTISNIIEKVGKKTLVLAHNKTLAGQLFEELRAFFPHNRVEYFISYYDYYQPEAYVVNRDLYIEKDASINDEIDQMRHSTTASLLERDDVIVVASVSCIYGIGSKEDYQTGIIFIRKGDMLDQRAFLNKLVELTYERNDVDFKRGTFRVRGSTVEVIPSNQYSNGIRVEFFGDEVERIRTFDVLTGNVIETMEYVTIFPATHFMTNKEKLNEAIRRIRSELEERITYFKNQNRLLEAERIKLRTNYDLEMLEEIGTCPGVENYARHMALREEGETPATLIDFFDNDFLMIIDESHVTLPQVRGMYNGDRTRKQNLVDYGFRLPSALDNRPLMFDEFDKKLDKVIYLSATPGDYELDLGYPLVEQIIRPTHLLDPVVEVRNPYGQMDDIYYEIKKRIAKNQRVLITTLTIRMSEDLTDYLKGLGLKVAYLHSEIKALERIEILRNLRIGTYDVVVGINLLREGLDLPEVSLVIILDADKTGFLRSERSLIQTIGRAARNVDGKVIMYAEEISEAMDKAITETNRRRKIQQEFNEKYDLKPVTVEKSVKEEITIKLTETDEQGRIVKRKSDKDLRKQVVEVERLMKNAARELDFERAAELRDLLFELKAILKI
jgi:excinuclease ABC subunit B